MGHDPNQPYPDQYRQSSNIPPRKDYPGGHSSQRAPSSADADYPYEGYQRLGSGSYQYQQPNSGYQYHQYQRAYSQPGPFYNTTHPNGPTTMKMNPNTAAGLSYLAWWVTGFIVFLAEKQSRFVRFHAMQAILLSTVLALIYIILGLFSREPFIGLFLWPLVLVVSFGIWLYVLINAFQGKYIKLPLIGNYAERRASPDIPGE